jgi:hypothetical protein
MFANIYDLFDQWSLDNESIAADILVGQVRLNLDEVKLRKI